MFKVRKGEKPCNQEYYMQQGSHSVSMEKSKVLQTSKNEESSAPQPALQQMLKELLQVGNTRGENKTGRG